MLNLHLLECTLKGYDHISDLLLAKYWVITGCKYANCSNLINVYCQPETPPAAICWYGENWGAFETNASGRKIYVPRGYGNIYKAADGWIDYEADIIEYDF